MNLSAQVLDILKEIDAIGLAYGVPIGPEILQIDLRIDADGESAVARDLSERAIIVDGPSGLVGKQRDKAERRAAGATTRADPKLAASIVSALDVEPCDKSASATAAHSRRRHHLHALIFTVVDFAIRAAASARATNGPTVPDAAK